MTSLRKAVVQSVLPMFHIYGFLVGISSILQGSKFVLNKRFHVENLFQLIEKHKVRI